MIKQIYNDIPLTDSYYGKKIHSYIKAYGFGYDFCRLYVDDNGGAVLFYNSLAVIDGKASEDMKKFMNMLSPVSIELSSENTLQLGGYKQIHRTLFCVKPTENIIQSADVEINCKYEDIFRILAEGFDDIDHDLWYTDISHRVRHGVARTYLYGGSTATLQFADGDFAFLSHIATSAEKRGKGGARNLVSHIAWELAENGTRAYLFAEDNRKSFYESFGTEKMGEDFLYQKEN